MANNEKIVDEVLKVLDGRKGFDHWWYEIDGEDQTDIRNELADAVARALE